MSGGVTFLPATPRMRRFDELCDELAELCGQQHVIAARVAEILAEIDHHRGAITIRDRQRSVPHAIDPPTPASADR